MSKTLSWLLNSFYLLLLVALAPWLLYQAASKHKYRGGFAEKLLGRVPRRAGERPCVWLHAVSVGEVNLLGALVAELRRRQPALEFAISTTTATGYEVAHQKYAEHLVFYCPLDFSWAVEAALARLRPNLLVLAELELWPNLIRAAKAQGVPVAVVNGRLSDKSFRGYRRVAASLRPIFRRLDLVAAQSQQYAERFRLLGAASEQVVVTGSMKFDGARLDRRNDATNRLRKLAEIADDDLVLLAGSTGEPEEDAALDVYSRLAGEFPRLRLIIVPRHPERFDEVARLIERRATPYVRRSRLGDERLPGGRAAGLTSPSARVLLVDTVGELSAWWGVADVAFVGGSLNSRGGQNMIEPAAYGAAVCFGPNTRNFRDIVALLLAHEAAVVVRDADEMQTFVQRALVEPLYAAGLGQRAQNLVRSQQGATARTVDRLEQLIGARPAAAARRVA